jgi:hypothetical protein
VTLNNLAPTGVEILVDVYFDVTDGAAELATRDGLVLDILKLAERLGVRFVEKT